MNRFHAHCATPMTEPAAMKLSSATKQPVFAAETSMFERKCFLRAEHGFPSATETTVSEPQEPRRQPQPFLRGDATPAEHPNETAHPLRAAA